MKKELKYLLYICTILFFIFFVLRYYFSENNKKKSYRTMQNNEKKIIIYSKNLDLLSSNTENLAIYVNNDASKKKVFNFWKLLN